MWHLFAAYDLAKDQLYGHIKPAPDRQAVEAGRKWAAADTAEIVYTVTNSSWLNRIEAQFTALRSFALDATDHTSPKDQA